jgi:alpha-tubulin suppressor-like RCC1 family protein
MPADTKPAPKPPLTSFGWGYNNYAGLGLGHTARVLSPTPVRLPEKTIDVQGGTDFSVALTSSGAVFAWGGNRWGQLGDGTTQQRFAWSQVKLPTRSAIVAISAGDDHVVALSKAGQVFGWGRNDVGQVGSGSLSDRQARPAVVPMPGQGKITRLAAGSSCSFAMTSSGVVYGWGHATPLGASVTGSQLGATKGGIGAVPVPVRLSLAGGASAAVLDAGRRHLVVVTTSGELLTYGVNATGRVLPGKLAIRAAWGRVAQVSAGDDHTLALTVSGVVLAWGSNRSGQLGNGTRDNSDAPVKVVIPGLRGRVEQVMAAGHSSFARTGNRVYGWGDSGWGQHGSGGTDDVLRPAAVTLPSKSAVTALYGGRFHCFASTAPAAG